MVALNSDKYCTHNVIDFTKIFLSFQLNVSYPGTGCQKLFEVTDDHKLRIFYEKRMGAEVEADSLGDEWKGYIVRITGGNDKQGFPMKQGILTNGTEKFKLFLHVSINL